MSLPSSHAYRVMRYVYWLGIASSTREYLAVAQFIAKRKWTYKSYHRKNPPR